MADKKTLDQDLFRQHIGTVTAIKSNKPHLSPNKKLSAVPRSQAINYQEHIDLSLEQDNEQLDAGDSLEFITPTLQKNMLKKMRKGYFSIDAEIDLHGLSRKDAQQQLSVFLHSSSQNGWRCVLVIHGKGYRSSDQYPVLKNSLDQWLRQHSNVLAFCSAKPADGGTGAVYVLLELSDKYGDQKYT